MCGDGHLGELAATLDEGYACTYFFMVGGGEVQTDWAEHGMCEGYSERPAIGVHFDLVEPPDHMKRLTDNDA